MQEASSAKNDQVVLGVVAQMYGHVQTAGKQAGMNNVALVFESLSDKTKPGFENTFDHARKALKAYGRFVRGANADDERLAITHMRAAVGGLDSRRASNVVKPRQRAPATGTLGLQAVVVGALRTLSERPSARLESMVAPVIPTTGTPLAIWQNATKLRTQDDDKLLFELAATLHQHAKATGPNGRDHVLDAVGSMSDRSRSDLPATANRLATFNAMAAYDRHLKAPTKDSQASTRQSVVSNMRKAVDGLSDFRTSQHAPTPEVSAVRDHLGAAIQKRSALDERYIVPAAIAVAGAPNSPVKHPSDIMDMLASQGDKGVRRMLAESAEPVAAPARGLSGIIRQPILPPPGFRPVEKAVRRFSHHP